MAGINNQAKQGDPEKGRDGDERSEDRPQTTDDSKY
jgi:hypothetical protein